MMKNNVEMTQQEVNEVTAKTMLFCKDSAEALCFIGQCGGSLANVNTQIDDCLLALKELHAALYAHDNESTIDEQMLQECKEFFYEGGQCNLDADTLFDAVYELYDILSCDLNPHETVVELVENVLGECFIELFQYADENLKIDWEADMEDEFLIINSVDDSASQIKLLADIDGEEVDLFNVEYLSDDTLECIAKNIINYLAYKQQFLQ